MTSVTASEDGFVLYVAYVNGEDEKKHYLGDGKGNVRIFKTETLLREHIRPLLSPDKYESVIIHPVICKLAIPEQGNPTGTIVSDSGGLLPISTLSKLKEPTANELLANYIQRRKRK